MYTITETPQEAWEKIYEYFSRPGAVIAFGKTSCMYRVGRDLDGAACAVGCLIPNEHYDEAMDERVGSIDAYDIYSLMHEGYLNVENPGTLALLGELQAMHDCSIHVKEFLESMQKVKPHA